MQLISRCAGRIAASYPDYDDVAAALSYLGYDADTVGLNSINSAGDLSGYRLYAVNCADGLEYTTNATASALAKFVYDGGKLYTSDYAFAVIEKAFPGKVSVPADPYCGEVETVRATVVDSRLRTLLGGASHVDLTYDLGAWVPLTGVGTGVTVLLEGEYHTYGEDGYSGAADAAPLSTNSRVHSPRQRALGIPGGLTILPAITAMRGPLAVTFKHGAGRVMHTTFHYHAHIGTTQLQLLDYLLLTD